MGHKREAADVYSSLMKKALAGACEVDSAQLEQPWMFLTKPDEIKTLSSMAGVLQRGTKPPAVAATTATFPPA